MSDADDEDPGTSGPGIIRGSDGGFLLHAGFQKEGLIEALDYLPLPALTCDRDGKWTFANQFAQQTLGRNMEGVFETTVLIHGNDDDVFDPRELPFVVAARENRVHSLHDIEVVVQNRRVPFFVWAKPVGWDADGAVDEILVVFLKDSQQSVIEEVQKARMDAENAKRAKNHFLANISHELRTPLTAVLGYLQLARGDADPKSAQNIELAREGAVKLQSLIDNILEVAKIEADELVLANTRYNLREVVSMIESQYAPQAELKGISFSIRIDNVSHELEGDREKIQTILASLVDNAVKFTNYGEISVIASTAEGQLNFEVRDTCVGIDKEAQEHLFEPFQQKLDYQSEHGRAAGLGLSICKSYVELMQGVIEVSSESGAGSTFSVSLPVEGITLFRADDYDDDDCFDDDPDGFFDDEFDDDDPDSRWDFLAEAICSLPAQTRAELVDTLLRADPVAFKQVLGNLELLPELARQMEYLVNTFQYDEVLSLCQTTHTH